MPRVHTGGRQPRANASAAPTRPRTTPTLKWAVEGRSLVRLRQAWMALSPEFREEYRLKALKEGHYLLQILEGTKGKDRK